MSAGAPPSPNDEGREREDHDHRHIDVPVDPRADDSHRFTSARILNVT